jgi:hypothetical protein
MTDQQPDRAERPRAEPEIIPPDRPGTERAGRSSTRASAVWISVGPDGTQRVQFAKPGLLSLFLFSLVVALLVAIILFVLFGAALILIPVAVLLFAAGGIVALWQRLAGPR